MQNINHLSDLVLTIFKSKGKSLTNLGLQKSLNLSYELYLKEYGVELFSKELIVKTRYGKQIKPINEKYKSKQSEVITKYNGLYLRDEDRCIVKLIEEVYGIIKDLGVFEVRKLEESNKD